MFHGPDENRIDPRFYHWPDSPLQYPSIDFPGETEEYDPHIVGTHPPVPLLKKGGPVQSHCPRLSRDATEPTTSRDLRYSGRISSTPDANYLSDFSLGYGRVLHLRFLNGRRVSGIEEILKVFLPPSDNIPSRGQQLPTSVINMFGKY